MSRLVQLSSFMIALLFVTSTTASALELTQRKLDVSGALNVAKASKLSAVLVTMDGQAEAPIFMVVTATEGTAQGVMLLADTIRSLRSPVVSVVTTQVHGAGAAIATFADRVVVYRSGGFAFTEVPYEGVKKYVEPPEPSAPKEGKDAKPKGKDAKAEGKDAKPSPKKKERETGKKFLQDVVRTQYLERFHKALAKRIHRTAKDLSETLEKEGGFILTPDQALKAKIADEVVDRITYTRLPEVKREVKVTTTDKVTTTERRSE
jgi:ATP-dependent protease ClpP protease subunit